ncbi:redoxin domain-containing protein [Lignipirellula cremea]|uniref:Thiol-disulfide oxidoreductase n=1 Tax=Lignipirellula cremea TaxID=2528010 RepID=A0A518E4D6_9BACT|nr:redoxin domain-containing protein [Lignipirellula cremea]QDU98975.1 hypothetical protein Pla8534_68860 [Lignipirellula cremea]
MRPSCTLLTAVLLIVPCAFFVPSARADEAGRVDLAAFHPSDIDGKSQTLFVPGSTAGVGIVFLSTECPVARRYLPEIGRLAEQFAGQGITVYGVISDRSVTRAAAKRWQSEFQIEFPVLFDASGELAAGVQPTHTPEAFVFDAAGGLVYRGRIDDFYGGVGRPRLKASRFEFRDALQAAVDGRKPAVAYAEPVGCPVEDVRTAAAEGDVTWCRDVAPILFQNCVACHREGAVAPFALTRYEDAARRAAWIAEVTRQRRMPPWKARPGFGHFQGERFLNQDEIATLAAWAKADAPQGDAADLPPTPSFPDGWLLGKPDMVVRMPQAIEIPADGADVFRYIAIPLDIPEDKYLSAVDFHAGNPLVVHHAIIAAGPEGFFEEMTAGAEMPGFDPLKDGLPRWLRLQQRGGKGFQLLGAWAPGSRPFRFPDGVGAPLRKGSTLLLQVHYAPSGKPETDQSEIAFYFCRTPVTRMAGGVGLNVMNLKIPAGEAEHRVSTSMTLPVDATLLGLGPHMHLLGRQMKVTAVKPDGTVEPLIWVDDWDWNWQGQYRFARPIRLPQGTRLDLEAVFDNSANNPANPHTPPQLVRFGRKTTDEMCLCFLQFALDEPEDQQALRKAMFRTVMGQFGSRFRLLFRPASP